LSSIWVELRRRHVIRATVTYAVVAVGVGGAADVFLPGLGAPDWALATVLVLLVLGLPLAAVLAWAYDISPEGLKRTLVDGDTASASVDIMPAASAPATVATPGAAAATAEESWTPDPKAIAVLPFANLSEDPANEYFSDGVTEDILTHLTEIADLHVPCPRRSTCGS
jgi:adenylate cyclase